MAYQGKGAEVEIIPAVVIGLLIGAASGLALYGRSRLLAGSIVRSNRLRAFVVPPNAAWPSHSRGVKLLEAVLDGTLMVSIQRLIKQVVI